MHTLAARRAPVPWLALSLLTTGTTASILLWSNDFLQHYAPRLIGHRLEPFLCACALVLAGLALGVAHVARGRDTRELLRAGAATLVTLLSFSLLVWGASFLAFILYPPVNSHGRRLRRFRAVRVPRTRRGSWQAAAPDAPLILEAPHEMRAQLGAAWRDTACKEHAAIAAFSQLSLDLLAVGAPPYLLETTQRDATDEIRHTATCFAIARAFDAEEHAPAPFPAARLLRPLAARSRPVALLQIALDSFTDGVLNEGMSARILARLAQRAEQPALGALLRGMAVDEARHASHSWRIVEWCVGEGGESVHRALVAAAERLPTRMEAGLDADAADGGWERWGLQGKRLEREAFEHTRDNALRKLAALSVQDAAAARARALRLAS